MYLASRWSVAALVGVCLFAGDSTNQATAKREALTFPVSTLNVVFHNPDPSTWHDLDIGNKPRPDMLNRTLEHQGIRDERGVNVKPVMSITTWRFPDDSMDLQTFSDYLLKRSPMKGAKRRMENGRLFIEGTASYGGYTHIIRRAFAFQNRIGIDLICDSTDTVFPKVREAFEAWLRTAEFTSRIVPTQVGLPKVAPAPPDKDEVVEIRKQVVSKREPGGALGGKIAGIQDHDGVLLIWNDSKPCFKMKIHGQKVTGYDSERIMFSVDDVFLQIQTTELTNFSDARALKDPLAILEAHRDWEYRYLQEASGVDCLLHSWSGTLADGSPVLYWEVTPSDPGQGPKKHVFCTRVVGDEVLVTNSVETSQMPLERARTVVFDAISHVEFSPMAFDMKAIQKVIQSTTP